MSICVVWLSKLCLLIVLSSLQCTLKPSIWCVIFFVARQLLVFIFGFAIEVLCRKIVIMLLETYYSQFHNKKLTCVLGGSYVIRTNYIMCSSCRKREGSEVPVLCLPTCTVLTLTRILQFKNLKPQLVLFTDIYQISFGLILICLRKNIFPLKPAVQK